MEEQLRAAPNDPGRRIGLGLALAYLGRGEEAIREGQRGVELDPVTKDQYWGPYSSTSSRGSTCSSASRRRRSISWSRS